MTKPVSNIPVLDSSLSFMMGLAYKQFRTVANQALIGEFDITLEMLGVLLVLEHLGQLNQQALSDTLHRERSVTKRLVDNCIKRDLVATHKGEVNKKARYIDITDKGRMVRVGASKRLHEVNDEFYAPLTSEERSLMLSLCKRLVQDDLVVVINPTRK